MRKGFFVGLAFGAATTVMLLQNDEFRSIVKKYRK